MVQHETLGGRAIQADMQRGGGLRHGRENFPSENIHPQATAYQLLIGIGEGVKAKNTTLYSRVYARETSLTTAPFLGPHPQCSFESG